MIYSVEETRRETAPVAMAFRKSICSVPMPVARQRSRAMWTSSVCRKRTDGKDSTDITRSGWKRLVAPRRQGLTPFVERVVG